MATMTRKRISQKEAGSSKKARAIDCRNGTGESGANEGFVDGAIFRVRMKNFLTYDECEFKPGPHLNVLLGPNGTGKSTVVCALCLGLAGGTKLLGRANECGEFVKHGCSNATIEVELFNSSGDNYIITRELQRVNNQSVWKINHRSATQKEVQELTKTLNVQISNLCQFLPQDKVVEFAKMSQQQLLEATQKAVGPPEMYDEHQKLIALRKSEKELELNLKEKQEHLEKLQQTNERLEHEVKRYKDRERHLEKVQILEKKRPWVEYEAARQEFMEIKKKKDEVKKRLEEARRQNAPMQQKLQQAEKKVKELDQKTRELTETGNTAARKAKSKSESLEKYIDKIDECNSELKDIKDQEKKRLKKISELERQINGFKNELEQLPNSDELQPKIEELNKEGRQIGRQVTEMQQQGSRLQDDTRSINANIRDVSGRIKELEDMNNQRMKYLRERYRDTYNAVIWLRNNKDKFKATIHEPILLQINVTDTCFAKYIETMISRDDQTAFVCENREDLKLFLSETKDKQRLRVSAVAPPEAPLSSFRPKRSLEQLRQWHFHTYLKDLFTAPDAVMRYLCETYRAHDIPLGTEWTANNADKVIEESGIPSFYTPSSKYSVKRSLYASRERSTMVSHIRDAQIFSVSVDVEAKKQLELELQGLQTQLQTINREYSEIQERERALTKQQEDLRNEKKKLQSHTQRRRTLANQLEAKQQALVGTQRQAPDQKAQEERIQHKIDQTNTQRAQVALQFKDLIRGCVKVSMERVMLSLHHAQVTLEKQTVEAAFRESSQLLTRLEAETNRTTEAFNSQKRRAKELRRFAQQKTNTPEGQDISPELREAFNLYPASLEEIDEMIHEQRARVECSYRTDPGVVREYEIRKREINNLSGEVDEKTKYLDEQKQEIENLKQSWLTPLQELIAKISEKYSVFFRRMGCAGEVTLSMDQGESDYDKYGVQIKVKFRAKDELHVLTPFHQSGGERSVSTMLYLMALQELTRCPFRVVDEINQGMDPNNERRVFELVVQTACRPNTAQYFLITPKLLPDLKFTDKMTILCVFNGHWMLNHNEWKLRDFINKKKRL